MKTRATVKRKTERRSQPAQRRRDQSTITVRLAGLGSKTRILRLPPGTTVKEIVAREHLGQSSIRLNNRPVRLLTKLKNRDVLVATPRSIVGGSAGRYDHLDLDRYRRTMTPEDFSFFTGFVGADRFGVTEDDLRFP